jgi:hypothetical protein
MVTGHREQREAYMPLVPVAHVGPRVIVDSGYRGAVSMIIAEGLIPPM